MVVLLRRVGLLAASQRKRALTSPVSGYVKVHHNDMEIGAYRHNALTGHHLGLEYTAR